MALPYFFLPGMDPKRRCRMPAGLHHRQGKNGPGGDPERSPRSKRGPEFLRVDRDLAQMLSQAMANSFKKNKEKVVDGGE